MAAVRTDHDTFVDDAGPAGIGPAETGPDGGDHGLTRRSALRFGAAVGATIVVAATGALSYRVFDAAVLDPDGGAAFDPWRSWRDDAGPLGMVGGAVLAASPHNTQPWLFVIHNTGIGDIGVGDTSIELLADRTRWLGSIDPFEREQHLGLGCAVENLVLAAGARGFVCDVTLMPDGSTGDLVARVVLSAGAPATPSGLYEVLGDRHTNRGPYRAEPVPEDVLAALVDTGDLPGVDVVWIVDAEAKVALGALLIDAAQAVTEDEQQSVDGFAWFRSDDDAIQRHRDGLTLDEQGLATVTLTLAKLLPATSRSAGDKFWLEQTRKVHTRTAAAYGVVIAADPYDAATQLRAGRLLQRTQLSATKRDIAFQHMNQITERIDRERSTDVAPTFGPRFSDLLPAGAQPVATFRVGHAVRSGRRSPRRPISDVTR